LPEINNLCTFALALTAMVKH
jgi:hypothetical protein